MLHRRNIDDTRRSSSAKARYWSKIAIFAPIRNIAKTFDVEKLVWCGHQTVKNFEDTFIRFDRIH